MNIGDKITYKRTTFRYGNSVAVVIPAQFDVPPKALLKLTIEMEEDPKLN